MANEAGALELLARFVGEALSPLADRLKAGEAAQLFEELGLRPPDALLGPLAPPLANGATAAQQLGASLPPLVAAIANARGDDTGSIVTLVSSGAATISKIAAVIQSVEQIANALHAGAAALTAAQRATVEAFAAELPARLLEYMLLAAIDRAAPRGVAYLALTGLADDALDAGDPLDPLKIPHRRRRLRLDALGKIAQDPAAHFRDLYGWGTPGFDGTELFARVANVLQAADLPGTVLHPPGGPAVLEALLVRATVGPDPAQPGAAPGLIMRLRQAARTDVALAQPLGSLWSFIVDARARFEAGIEGGFFPGGQLRLTPPTGTVDAQVEAGLRAAREGQPTTLIGLAGATRLEFSTFQVTAGGHATWDAVSGRAEAEPTVSVSLEKLTCVLDLGGGDSFLKSLSGGGRGRADVTTGATWSPRAGLKFTGSATVEIAIPAHAAIGPATIDTIYVVSGFRDGKVPLELSASVRGELGPFKASVDRIGVAFEAAFPPAGGNLGPVDLGARFKPPEGVGLSISGGGITGGGFLRLDPDHGEYAGGIELQFQDVINLKAVGLLNTIMPDGSDGFSLLVIITAEFVPIQLGFGFTLIGVGGLLGVNRTILFEPLRMGVHDGSLSSILFPQDIAANAPRIIADLKRIFPPLNGHFLIGPMGKLGWGTPTLISLEIGVLLEIPRPAFAVLGILRMALPAEDVAILNLQVSFIGIVDFERKELSFDASLFDSRVLTFTLTGDMAVRLYWGDNANFLLTVGGFHPAFTPPPMGLGDLKRLAIIIFSGNPNLRAEAYFAVTSNTVQFGARIELYAGADIFNVYGFLALDALIQFDPFHFVIQIGAMLAVRSGSSTLMSIRLDLVLEGPTPWHAHGTGTFEISFIFTISISVSFDVTFGEDRNTSLPPVSVRELIEAALGEDGNWRVARDGNLRNQVSLRQQPPEAPLLLPPMGVLGVSQKVAPLNLKLERFGPRHVVGSPTFAIVDVSFGSPQIATSPVTDRFPAAQFLDMSDAEKLSRPSFEPFASGVEIAGGNAPKADHQRGMDVTYEVIYFRKPRLLILLKLSAVLQSLWGSMSAAALSTFGNARRVPTGLGTPEVRLETEGFAVAGTADLRLHAPHLVFDSHAAASSAVKDLVRADPSLRGKVQVVGSYEVAA